MTDLSELGTAVDPPFPYLRFRLQVRPVGGVAGDAEVDGPRLRRAFGRELVRRFCPFGAPRCQESRPAGGCPQVAMCPYAQVFARFGTARPRFAVATGSEPIGPFADLTLFGDGWRFYPWAVQALEDALSNGIGGWPSRWRVRRVSRLHPDGRRSQLTLGPHAPIETLASDALPIGPQPGDADLVRDPRPVAVELETPTRLTFERRVLAGGDPVPFEVLVARAAGRVADLFGAEAVAALEARCGHRDPTAVALLVDRTRFVRQGDYSRKKDRVLDACGKVGTLVYGEGAAAFLPLLRVAELVHVGKNAAAGFGRVRVRLLTREAARFVATRSVRRAREARSGKPWHRNVAAVVASAGEVS